ncbi:MAG: hypothetical protein AAF413_02065 [Patescibacteria group bacterium]
MRTDLDISRWGANKPISERTGPRYASLLRSVATEYEIEAKAIGKHPVGLIEEGVLNGEFADHRLCWQPSFPSPKNKYQVAHNHRNRLRRVGEIASYSCSDAGFEITTLDEIGRSTNDYFRCGVNSGISLLRLFGGRTDKVRDRLYGLPFHSPSGQIWQLEEIAKIISSDECAESIGFKVNFLKLFGFDLEEVGTVVNLLQEKYPSVFLQVPIESYRLGMLHYVFIQSVENGVVYYCDPKQANVDNTAGRQFMGMTKFMKHWGVGHMISYLSFSSEEVEESADIC